MMRSARPGVQRLSDRSGVISDATHSYHLQRRKNGGNINSTQVHFLRGVRSGRVDSPTAENGSYRPIGDVTFWQEDMPIVIGERKYRGKGIGRRVVSALVQRGRELGYEQLEVDEIYDWNEGSRRCFESVGFRAYEKTEKGSRYRLCKKCLINQKGERT